jgi:hypothetical protein
MSETLPTASGETFKSAYTPNDPNELHEGEPKTYISGDEALAAAHGTHEGEYSAKNSFDRAARTRAEVTKLRKEHPEAINSIRQLENIAAQEQEHGERDSANAAYYIRWGGVSLEDATNSTDGHGNFKSDRLADLSYLFNRDYEEEQAEKAENELLEMEARSAAIVAAREAAKKAA